MHCYLWLELFAKQQSLLLLLDARCGNDVARPNEQVKKNRLILRGFIDAACYLADQELPFRGQD